MTDRSALSLFPSRVSIGTVQPDGRVVMSPEFFRALQKLFTQFEGVRDSDGAEIFAQFADASYEQGDYAEAVYSIQGLEESGPEVFQPPDLAYELSLKQSTSAKDQANGYVGLTGYSINFKDAAGTYTSGLSNTNTAARSYAFPDRSITVAGLDDITGGINNISAASYFIAAGSPGMTGTIDTTTTPNLSVVGGLIIAAS